MSWSVSVIGKPEKVVEKLAAYVPGNEQSNREYEEAKPHLQALVSLAVGQDYLVQLEASGHVNFAADGTKIFGNISVNLHQCYWQMAL